MSKVSFVNGKYINSKNAKISVNDRSILFADSVYEVIGVYNQKFIFWKQHMQRLKRSLYSLDIKKNVNNLYFIANELLEQNNLDEGIIYVQISRGIQNRNHTWFKNLKPSLIMSTKKINFFENYYKAVDIITDKDIRWKNCHIKSTSLLPNILSKQKAFYSKSYDCWLIDENDYITEGTVSNAWIVKNKIIYTSPESLNILSGVTKNMVLKCAKNLKYNVSEKKFTLADALRADEAFLTNTTALIKPILKINNKIIGKNNANTITTNLQGHFRKFILKDIVNKVKS